MNGSADASDGQMIKARGTLADFASARDTGKAVTALEKCGGSGWKPAVRSVVGCMGLPRGEVLGGMALSEWRRERCIGGHSCGNFFTAN
jgi:hypothetical protein